VVPADKDPEAVDRKLISRYGIDISKWERARRKKAGHSNMQYIRFERFFVLLSTHGEHRFFQEEADSIRDARKSPIYFERYSISFRGGHPHVRIEKEEYKRMKAYFVDLAVRRSVETLCQEFGRIPFEPYAPVRRQLLSILRSVNRERKTAGFEPVPKRSLRFLRRIYRPFSTGDESDELRTDKAWETRFRMS
jgi:hypothetical protein